MSSKKARGQRAKTRSLLKRRGSKATISKLLAQFGKGQRVQIRIDSGMHSGIPHKRFHGSTGVVTGKQGNAYTLKVELDHVTKNLVVNAAHLKAAKG